MIARRRPLLRTAAVAGTAAYVGNKAGQRGAQIDALEAQQAQQYAAPPPPPAYAPPAAPPPAAPQDRMEALERLAALHNSGALTDEEFAFEKRRILAG